MSIPEARRAERLVFGGNDRQALDDWIIVAKDQRNLLIKDPDSTDGLAIQADWSIYVGEVSGIVELEIRADFLFGQLLVQLASFPSEAGSLQTSRLRLVAWIKSLAASPTSTARRVRSSSQSISSSIT